MIMEQVLLDDIVERSFAEHEHAIEGFFFDGAYKAFTMGIEIGTPWRQEDGFHPAALEQSIESLGEFGVPVVEHIAFPQQESRMVKIFERVFSAPFLF
jgi:hypothetical protein